MNLNDIKTKITKSEIIHSLLIFKYSDSDFIPHQYIHKEAEICNLNIVSLESLEDYPDSLLFDESNLYIYKIDKFECQTPKYINSNNLIIICKTITKDTEKIYKDFIVVVPKLELWQILDYIDFNCPTLYNELKFLPQISTDMFFITNEIDKIAIFSPNKAEIDSASADTKALPGAVFKTLTSTGAWNYLTSYSIFDFITALLTKDINTINKISNYSISIVPMLFYQLIYQTVELIIKIIFDNTSTAEKLGISAGRYWAIKKTYNNIWQKENLTNILSMLTGIDLLIKTGKLNTDSELVDYILTNIFLEY